MFSERFQILITPEQRSRLEEESRTRGVSVASLVRDAIDARFGKVSREQKIRAAEEIAALASPSDLPLTVAAMHDIIDEGIMRSFPHLSEPQD